MLWVLKRTVSMRRFFWAPKTYVKLMGRIMFTILCSRIKFEPIHSRALVMNITIEFQRLLLSMLSSHWKPPSVLLNIKRVIVQPTGHFIIILIGFIIECHIFNIIHAHIRNHEISVGSTVGASQEALFGLVLIVPVNSYGHVGTVSSFNHTFF